MSNNPVDLGRKLLDASRNGHTDSVLALTQSGAPFTTDWLGTTPLHLAARYGHTESAEILLKAGVSRDARTKLDRTALHVAAQEGHLDIVELLLAHGADSNARDMLKMTPLHWAVQRCHISVVERLLLGGSDPNAISKFSVTPSDMAEELGYFEIFRLLQSWTIQTPCKSSAQSHGNYNNLTTNMISNNSNNLVNKHTINNNRSSSAVSPTSSSASSSGSNSSFQSPIKLESPLLTTTTAQYCTTSTVELNTNNIKRTKLHHQHQNGHLNLQQQQFNLTTNLNGNGNIVFGAPTTNHHLVSGCLSVKLERELSNVVPPQQTRIITKKHHTINTTTNINNIMNNHAHSRQATSDVNNQQQTQIFAPQIAHNNHLDNISDHGELDSNLIKIEPGLDLFGFNSSFDSDNPIAGSTNHDLYDDNHHMDSGIATMGKQYLIAASSLAPGLNGPVSLDSANVVDSSWFRSAAVAAFHPTGVVSDTTNSSLYQTSYNSASDAFSQCVFPLATTDLDNHLHHVGVISGVDDDDNLITTDDDFDPLDLILPDTVDALNFGDCD